MNSIITAHEAVKFSPMQDNYPTAYVCTHIKRVEYKLFNRCYLGLALMKALIADLTPLSKAKEYDSSLTYNEGDLICYSGITYISLVNDNDLQPDDPSEIDQWSITRKFKSDCYQQLWDNHLKYWLALEIMYESIRYSTYQAGSKGLTKIVDDSTGVATVNSKEFGDFKKELKADAADQLEVMFDWMVDQHQSKACDFKLVEKVVGACGESSCAPPKKRRGRRFYFKH